MDGLGYLFAGFAVFWAGLFGYLVFLQMRLRAVQHDLERLAERLEEGAPAGGTPGGGERSGPSR
jgi:CcmD family protein